MVIKFIIIVAFILIIFSLGSALLYLVKRRTPEESNKTVNALTLRIAISVALFIFVAILLMTGLVKPTGIGARMHRLQMNEQASEPAAESTNR